MVDQKLKLNAQQSEAIEAMRSFVNDEEGGVFILRGYAGTGKTTLIAQLVEELVEQRVSVSLMAPTGRAAMILGSKVVGELKSKTIHSTIYKLDKVEVHEEEGKIQYRYPLINRETHSLVYVVDEASMVPSQKSINEIFVLGSGSLMNDLLDFIPIKMVQS